MNNGSFQGMEKKRAEPVCLYVEWVVAVGRGVECTPNDIEHFLKHSDDGCQECTSLVIRQGSVPNELLSPEDQQLWSTGYRKMFPGQVWERPTSVAIRAAGDVDEEDA